MSYYEQIDQIGESDIEECCTHCEAPNTSYRGYCSSACYNYDTK